MALDKSGLTTALQSAFSGTHDAATAAGLIADAIDAYVKTATTSAHAAGTYTCAAAPGPVTGTSATGTLS